MAEKSTRSSIVEFFYTPGGPSEGECGYCDTNESVSYGVWAHQIDSELYSGLYLHGWSRVGKYVFKEVNERTCCPPYAISCDASNFVLSKSQKKTLIKFCRYLETNSVKETSKKEEKRPVECKKRPVTNERTLVDRDGDVASEMPVTTSPGHPETPKDSTNHTVSDGLTKAAVTCRVAPGKPVTKNTKKTVSDFITVDAPMVGKAHRLDVNLVKLTPPSPDLQWTINESYVLYRKYRAIVHNKKESDEECRRDFKARCLDSPFVPCFGQSEGLDYGTYHCHYYLDGNLFMVGVVDFVPRCFISAYLFYDPKYRFLSPGTFSALYEIALFQHLTKSSPSLRHYCMDQYVHSTHTMSYKRNFSPSYLLCPRTNTWHPIEGCIAKLEKNKCAYFSAAEQSMDNSAISSDQGDLDDVPILLIVGSKDTRQTHKICYLFLRVLLGRDQEKVDAMVREYVGVVGRVAASNASLLITSNILQKFTAN